MNQDLSSNRDDKRFPLSAIGLEKKVNVTHL